MYSQSEVNRRKKIDIFDINNINLQGNSALSIAVSNDNIEIVKILIRMGADINNTNSNNESPYSIAIAKNNRECIELFNKILKNTTILNKV